VTDDASATTRPAGLLPRLLLTVAGMVGFIAILLAAYFAAPVAEFDLSSVRRAGVLAGVALGLLIGLYLYGIRRLPRSEMPLMRAVFLAVALLATFVVVFAYLYLSLETRDPGQVPGLTTHLDGLYFTVTMLTTVGFGDIAPAGQGARAVATVQMVFNLVFLGFLIRSGVTFGRRERDRRRKGSAHDSTRGHRAED
jgi:hypothetical protein